VTVHCADASNPPVRFRIACDASGKLLDAIQRTHICVRVGTHRGLPECFRSALTECGTPEHAGDCRWYASPVVTIGALCTSPLLALQCRSS
jgi:hypothetical protein